MRQNCPILSILVPEICAPVTLIVLNNLDLWIWTSTASTAFAINSQVTNTKRSLFYKKSFGVQTIKEKSEKPNKIVNKSLFYLIQTSKEIRFVYKVNWL